MAFCTSVFNISMLKGDNNNELKNINFPDWWVFFTKVRENIKKTN